MKHAIAATSRSARRSALRKSPHSPSRSAADDQTHAPVMRSAGARREGATGSRNRRRVRRPRLMNRIRYAGASRTAAMIPT